MNVSTQTVDAFSFSLSDQQEGYSDLAHYAYSNRSDKILNPGAKLDICWRISKNVSESRFQGMTDAESFAAANNYIWLATVTSVEFHE